MYDTLLNNMSIVVKHQENMSAKCIPVYIDVTREVRTNFKIMLAVSLKSQIYKSISAQYLCFIYQNNFRNMDICNTTTIHVFDCTNNSKIQTKKHFFTQKRRVTRNKN